MFASDSQYPSSDNPISMFMAGSPGAGKTEFSKRLIEAMVRSGSPPIVRIDPDEIRTIPLPGYTGNNAYVFKHAASKGVDVIHDYVLKKKKSFILDGTFSNFDFSKNNVQRSLKRNRLVVIVYLYQDPLVAWDFTKKRELQDHRNIPKAAFIEELFAAKENVNKIKKKFGQKVLLWLIERDLNQPEVIKQSQINIDSVDNHISVSYTKDQLEQFLQI